MPNQSRFIRPLAGALGVAIAAYAGGAAAIDFQIGEDTLKIESLFQVGASFRMQERDPTLIGKSTLFALNNGMSESNRTGLCMTRTSGSAAEGPSVPDYENEAGGDTNQLTNGVSGAGVCGTSGDVDGPTGPAVAGSANTAYLQYPGSFSPNGDNGDLNFDKGDLVHAVVKLTTDLNFSKWDYNLFIRGVALFDANYTDFTEFHPDTTLQAGSTELPHSVERLVGMDFDILDYNIGHVFSPAGHDVSMKLGAQVLNWGESSLLALNSLNTINPPDARRLNMPGLDLKEAFRPIGMLTLDTQIIDNVSIQTFYTYEWKPIVVDPVGSYFSQSDTLGDGGDYAMLSFAKSPEDPGFAVDDPRYPAGRRGHYRPIDTCTTPVQCSDSLGLLGSWAGRTVYRDHKEEEAREPEGGDYGAAVKLFLESINNGTELAFYYANYDSRIPSVSSFASLAGCLDGVADLAPGGKCGYNGPGMPADEEPIPVDTMRLIVEYPENIHLYGVSFNTTVGDYALSGEYAFRDNLPVQIDTVDLTYTSLQPAFPATDVSTPAATIPGRQSAFPSYLTRYRGYACTSDADCIQPNQYIQGYERLSVGQANLTVLRLIGGDNPLGASQMTFLLEMGMQKVFDMPAIGELQLEGTGSDTHISNGGDGSQGLDPPPVTGNTRANTLRQNPTANTDYEAYGTSESYGFRLLNLNRFDSAIFGANLETLAIIRDDVKGTSPGIATNFSEGRKQFNFGLRFDYLSQWNGEVRYTWFMGKHDGQRDRDNIFVTLGYQF
jgi:hypothetical protein